MLLWAGQFGTVVLLSQWLSSKVYEAHITKVGSRVRCLIATATKSALLKTLSLIGSHQCLAFSALIASFRSGGFKRLHGPRMLRIHVRSRCCCKRERHGLGRIAGVSAMEAGTAQQRFVFFGSTCAMKRSWRAKLCSLQRAQYAFEVAGTAARPGGKPYWNTAVRHIYTRFLPSQEGLYCNKPPSGLDLRFDTLCIRLACVGLSMAYCRHVRAPQHSDG